MKKRVLFAFVAAAASVLPMSATEYKPLLEEGKSWTIQYHGTNYSSINPYTHGMGMDNFVHQFTAKVVGDTIIDGKHCWYVTKGRGKYLLHEEGETVYYCTTDYKGSVITDMGGRPEFMPIMKFDVNVGDKLPCWLDGEGQIEIEDEYSIIKSIDSVMGPDGVSRREVATGRTSWVEGVGYSYGYNLIGFDVSGQSSYGPMSFETLDCAVNGTTIFTHKDFKMQYEDTGSNAAAELLTPGKSWTMARGEEIFTVSVVGDTLVCSVPAKVLVDSNGKQYIVIAHRGTLYGFFDKNGNPNPLTNAVPLIEYCMNSESKMYRYIFGKEPEWDDEKDDLTNRYLCKVQSVNTLDVRGVERKEWVLEDAESGEVVASWVEGVGAPDAQSWATQMPEGYDLRMIDCRQDGEVIFTAEDFTHKSGIAEVTADRAERSGIYDLQGRRVSSPGRGLYIVDGKKTLLR